MTNDMRILCITVMRNEASFILEWLAYHKTIGVTDFLIYSNDCDDGTDLLLDRLQDLGIVAHLDNPQSGKKTVQWKALNRARNHDLTKQADWILVSDVDEFLTIHVGDGKIADLFAARPDAAGFFIDWRMFGSSGIMAYEDKFIIEQFTRAAPESMLWPWRAVQFKSLYRNDPRYSKLGVHRPKVRDGLPMWEGWVHGSGVPVARLPCTIFPTMRPRYTLAQLNHYALGSVGNFLVKAARGKPNHSDDPINLFYWIDRNFNVTDDTRILRHLNTVRAQVSEWRKDPKIDQLHEQGVDWRKKKARSLLDQLFRVRHLIALEKSITNREKPNGVHTE